MIAPEFAARSAVQTKRVAIKKIAPAEMHAAMILKAQV